MKPSSRFRIALPILLLLIPAGMLSSAEISATAASEDAPEAAPLLFPVVAANESHIVSVFGDGRDEGTRKHEGIDIAAPRGTLVVAPVRAYVRKVGQTERGGNVITLHDRERNIYLFFAHLETQEVETGTLVEPGQVIGTVGSSGNASPLFPHLHFSVYQGRWQAVDPAPYILPANPVQLDAVIRNVPAGSGAESASPAAP